MGRIGNHLKKLISVVTIVALTTTLLPQFTSNVSAATPPIDDCGRSLVSTGTVPRDVPLTNKQNFQLNKTLFFTYGIVAYGPMTTNSPSGNWFEKGHYPQGGPHIETAGRFKNGSECGEWFFYGYDYEGNPYNNTYFKPTHPVVVPSKDKRWVWKPWIELPNNYWAKPSTPGPVYSGTDPMATENLLIRQTIRQSLNFSVNNGIQLSTGYKTTTGDDLAKYAVVETYPTLRIPGSATLYHKTSAANSGFLTTTFELLPLTNKNPTPISVTTTASPKPIDLSKAKGSDSVTFTVRVDAKINDEAFTTAQQKAVNYTRTDIDHWDIKLYSNTGALLQTAPANKIQWSGNKASTEFTVTMKVKDIPSDNQYLITGQANAIMIKNVATLTARDDDFAQFTKPDQHFVCSNGFELTSLITIQKSSDLTPGMYGYRDASGGECASFSVKVFEPISGKSQTLNFTKPALTVVDQKNINNMIHDFVKKEFADENPISTKEVQFYVEQTATEKGGKEVPLVVKWVKVKQWRLDDPGIGVEIVFVGNDGHYVTMTPPAKTEEIAPEAVIPDKWYDVVPFPAVDNTEGWISRTVSIDGVSVDPDLFFGGGWTSGLGTEGLRNIVVEWETESGLPAKLSTWTVIYDTKPRVQLKFDGLFKQNRTMTVTNTSDSAGIPFVIDRYPNTYTFEFIDTTTGDESSRRVRTDTDLEKVFLYKEPGIYKMSISATNELGRVSDPYIVDYEILPDEKPAVILHPFDSQVVRGSEVRLMHETSSVDGDIIASQWVKLWYDSDNDGTFETLVQQWDNVTLESIPAPNTLGSYMVEGYALESTTQDTLAEFVTPADAKDQTFKTYFAVDNYQPVSDLYIDHPIDKPNVDVYFLLDSALNETQRDFMNANEVTNTNKLADINVIPSVDTWDMHTYTYYVQASTSRNTGTSYPALTYTHTTADGFTGVLDRGTVSNSPWSRDEGSNHTRKVEKTYSASFSGSCTNTRTRSKTVTKDPKTGKETVTYSDWSGSSSDCPGSQPVNSDGYSGSIPRTGDSQTRDDELVREWVATYSGSLSKTVIEDEQYWVPNIVWYDDYTAAYSGTASKDVRQTYDNKFFNTISDKYIVYITSGGINDSADLQMTMAKNDAKLVCVGPASMQSQANCSFHIPNNKPMNELVDDIVKHISESSPANLRIYRLVGENIETQTATSDAENDPIIGEQFKIWQDMSWFTDPLGFDNSEGAFKPTSYASATWGTYESIVNFGKPGKYMLIRKVTDQPTPDPAFADYSYDSNESTIEVIVHRKPIAQVTLDWDYDVSQNNYLTRWVDESYDLDHEFNRPDRGIVERELSLRNNGTGELLYTIPARLSAGNYTLTYAVKDPEGAWSDLYTRTFTLENAPPMQFNAFARTQLPEFSMTSVPASENLLAYDMWSRYPYTMQINVNIPGNSRVILQNSSTGTRTGNDTWWNNFPITIPATQPDGNYNMTVSAVGSGGGNNTVTHTFPFTVFTPINLMPRLLDGTSGLIMSDSNGPGGWVKAEITTGEPYRLGASTSKYVTSLQAILFRGSSYQTTMTLTQSSPGSGIWTSANFTVPTVPDADYTIRWTATTASGKQQVIDTLVKTVQNRPPVPGFTWQTYPDTVANARTEAINPIVWEGDVIDVIGQVSDPDRHLSDPLTVLYTITYTPPVGAPTTSTMTFTTSSVGGVYSTSQPGPRFDALPGTYRIVQMVTDSRGRTNIGYYPNPDKTIVVRALQYNAAAPNDVNLSTFAPFVTHRATWDMIRNRYNVKYDPNRTTNTFWAGEQFILSADFRNNLWYSARNTTRINSVDVVFRGNANGSTVGNITHSLARSTDLFYTSELFRQDFESLNNGVYNFEFTIRWNNGTVKTATVPIVISGKASEILNSNRTD